MEKLKKLPIGEQSFAKLRRENRLYVDKTEYVYKVTQDDGAYFFLSRPRRFGKSLFLNTIEAYFLGKRELFEGLYLNDVEKEWAVYPVMHLDFNTQNYTNEEDLYQILDDFLREHEKLYKIEDCNTSVALRFKHVIRQAYEQTGKGVVILVDEYDKPLLQTIGNVELQEKYRGILRGFYSVLKTMDECIRFAFLTGITKFSKISIFSDLNNLRDISREREYGMICGLTDKEIDRDLAFYIRRFAEQMDTSYEELRTDLRRMYDGYHFVADSVGLYNPFSIMCALTKREFGSYWFETGTPTMLVEMLQRKQYELPTLEESVNDTALDSKDGDGDSIVPLLYQSGYLSIKRSNKGLYWLTFPNEEVQDGFFQFLLPYYTSVQKSRTKAAIQDFVDDVREGRVEQFLLRLQSFFADYQYGTKITPEAHFQNVMYILLKLIGLQVEIEHKTSDGRIDLLITTDKYRYVIECKIDSTPAVALKQIHDKEYGLPWALDEKQTMLIGLNFSTGKRRPDGWIVEDSKGKRLTDSSVCVESLRPEVVMGKVNEQGIKLSGNQTFVLLAIAKNRSITHQGISEDCAIPLASVNSSVEALKKKGVLASKLHGLWRILI